MLINYLIFARLNKCPYTLIENLFMKRINEYRKLLGVDKDATLRDLKTVYRNTMKDAHPDKFINDDAGKTEAEETSKTVIEAYHFLVSINK